MKRESAHVGDPWSMESWAELAFEWQRALGECAAWWTGVAAGAPATRRQRSATPGTRDARQPTPASPFDAEQVKQLHEH
jgi:hypothetical protein